MEGFGAAPCPNSGKGRKEKHKSTVTTLGKFSVGEKPKELNR